MRYTIEHYRETCPKHGHASAECTDACQLAEERYQIEGEVSAYVPARTSGPPDNCYPAEGGEVEILDVNLATPEGWRQIVDWEKHFTDREFEDINQKLFDAMMDDDGYDYEPDDDYDDDL